MYTFQLLAQEIVNTPLPNATATQSNIIGIGGIIATIMAAIVTCIITWLVANRSIKQMKLDYSMKLYPLLANDIKKTTKDDIKIYYKHELLDTPYMLAIDIENVGNKAIVNPPIKIKNSEDIKMIPGYFENLDSGYEALWSVENECDSSCKINLEHINPKQTVHLCIYLNKNPQKEFEFECPMADLQIQKANTNVGEKSKTNTKKSDIFIINIALIAISMLCLITVDSWDLIMYRLFIYTGALLDGVTVVLFTIAVLILTVIVNVCKIHRIETFIIKHRRRTILTSLSMLVLSGTIVILLAYNILFLTIEIQSIVAILTVLMLSISLHLLIIAKVR